MALALRMGGFEIRDLIGWCFWSGFPKSQNVAIQIDKQAGAIGHRGQRVKHHVGQENLHRPVGMPAYVPNTDDAKRWSGFGTALKPAIEPAWLVRKPITESSIARNVLRWGTGAINIDGCRFGYGDRAWVGPAGDVGDFSALKRSNSGHKLSAHNTTREPPSTLGRWPANLYHCPKASTAEREAGCDDLPTAEGHELTGRDPDSAGLASGRSGASFGSNRHNLHPTVKPVDLMRWLCRLVTPPGGLVIDPYTGSGTTGIGAVLEGLRFAGCEMNNEDGPPPQRFVDIAEARIRWWERYGDEALDVWRASTSATEEREQLEAAGQVSLFGGVT